MHPLPDLCLLLPLILAGLGLAVLIGSDEPAPRRAWRNIRKRRG